MRIRSFVPCVLVLSTALGGLGVGPVLAQAIKEPGWPPPEGAACKPSKSDDADAHTLFNLGAKAEETSNYTDAIKYYKDGYKRACNRPVFLKNLGRVYEKDGQYAAAVEAYKLYRERGKPTGDELDQLDAKIANLSKKAQEKGEPAGTTTGTATTTTTGTTTTTAAPTSTDTAPTGTATTTATAVPTGTAPPPEGKKPIAPWIVAGAGAAVAIGGTVVWIVENSTVSKKQDEFNANKCAPPNVPKDRALCQSLADDGNSAKSARTVGIIMTGVGVAALAGGLVWAFTAKPEETKTAKPHFQITPGPGLAGIGLSGVF